MSSAENAKKFNLTKLFSPGTQGGPLMHVIAAKAVCLKEALQPEFKEYARMVVENAQALCQRDFRTEALILYPEEPIII